MSVLIKGMAKPKSCVRMVDGELKVCPFVNNNDDCVLQLQLGRHWYSTWEAQYAGCPLVELPEKHGRLIDADELKTAFPRCDNNMDIKIASVRATVNHMPTIIEAEGE